MNKNLLYVGLLILIIVVGAAGNKVMQRYHSPGGNDAARFRYSEVPIEQSPAPKLEVATDPSFTEVKDKLIEGFPEFPVYPGATLEASAKVNSEGQTDMGYRVKWETHDPVPKIARWYERELAKAGWKVTPSSDPQSEGEQVIKIEKDIGSKEFSGYVAPEMEGDEVEIIVDLRLD